MKAVTLLDQPLYHSRLLPQPTVPAGDYTFFKVPIGGTEDNTTLTDYETNNTFAGALPENEYYRIDGFSVRLVTAAGGAPASVDAARAVFYGRTLFILKIANTEFFKIPLRDIPSGNDLWTDLGGSTSTSSWTNGIQSVRNVYRLKRPIILPTQRPFEAIVRFLSPASIGTVNLRLYVYLHGLRRAPAFK